MSRKELERFPRTIYVVSTLALMALAAALLLRAAQAAPADTDPPVILGQWQTYNLGTPGFPSSIVTAAAPDDQGRLWIGTSGGGVGMFDGDSWTTYTVFNTGSGLASNNIRSLDTDGDFLYVGTIDAGLSVYDTVQNTWATYNTGNTPALLSNQIEAIQATGSIWWLATPAGLHQRLSLLGTPVWNTFTTANSGLSDNDVRSLAFGNGAALWIGTCGGGLDRLANSVWTSWSTSNSALPADCVRKITIAEDGARWMAVSTPSDLHLGVARFDGSNWTHYTPANSGLQDNLVTDLSADRVGRVWIATASQGLNLIDGAGNWGWYHTGNSDLPSNQLLAATVNGERIWTGTYNAGAVVFDPNWQTFDTTSSGLAHDFVYTVLLEPGEAWFGTNGGLGHFDGSTWTTYTASGPLPHNQVLSLAVDDSGNYWVGTAGGLAVFDGAGGWAYHSTADGLPHNQVNALTMDALGRMWAATLGGAAVYDGGWVAFNSANSPLTSNNVQTLALDSFGAVWVGTNGGGIGAFNGNKWTMHTTAGGLPSDNVVALARDGQGNMWAGTWGGGVGVYDGTAWTTHSTANGLPSDTIENLAVDETGRVWVTTDDGGVALWNGGKWQTHTPRTSGLAHWDVPAAGADAAGSAWFGTQGSGVSVRGPFSAPLALPQPTISDFTPGSGLAGTVVTLSGTNFDDRGPEFNTVRLGLTELAATDITSTTLEVEIPPYAVSSQFSVETVGGDATSAQLFVVEAGVSSFEPLGGSQGMPVTFYGANLHEIDEVYFDQAAAPVTAFEAQTATTLTVRVPAGAATGRIELVDTDAGNSLITNDIFTVTQLEIASIEVNQGVAGYELINAKDTLVVVSLDSSSDQFPAYVDQMVLTVTDQDGGQAYQSAAFLYNTTIAPGEAISVTQNGTALFQINGSFLINGSNLFFADYDFSVSAQVYEGAGAVEVEQSVVDERFRQPHEYWQGVLQPWFLRILTMEIEDSFSLPGGVARYLSALDTLSRLYPVADGITGPNRGLDVVFLPDRLRFAGYQCEPGNTDAWDLGNDFRTYESFVLMEARRMLYNATNITHPALFNMAFLHQDCLDGSTTGIAAPPPIGSSMTALTNNSTGATAAQELGHSFGRVPPWAPNRCWPGTGCPGGGGISDNHSRFQVAAPAGVRAYNIFTGQNITADNPSVMSYAGGQTDSNVLFEINDYNCIHTFPSPVCSGPTGSQPFPTLLSTKPGPNLVSGDGQDFVLIGLLAEDGSVEVFESRLQPAAGKYPPASGDDYQAVYLQGSNELAALPFDPVFDHTHGPASLSDGPGLISLRQPFPSGADRVEIRHENVSLVVIAASAAAPEVTLLAPNGGEVFGADEEVLVEWGASDPDGDPLTYSVEYSSDNGASWIAVTSAFSQTQYLWETGWAKGTTQGLLRVTASDGLHTASDASDAAFSVKGKPPMVAVTGLTGGQVFSQYGLINLHGLALDLEDGLLPDASLSWESNLDGPLGTGNGVWFEGPSLGVHQITLTAADSDGNSETAQATIEVARDFDRDGLIDAYEDQYASLNFWDPEDARLDGDADGLTNLEEAFWGCHPEMADSDSDSAGDGEEVAAGSDCQDGASLPQPPDLALGPTALAFEAFASGPQTPVQAIEVANAGGGSLAWSTSPNVPWLIVNQAAGTGTGLISIAVDPALLSPGQYVGEVSISAGPGTANSPQTVIVNLNVVAGGQTVYLPILVK